MSEKGYDEQDAVDFIRECLPEKIRDKYDDDEILFVIDIIWDWYDKHGFTSLDMDASGEDDVDVTRLTDFVKREIQKSEFIEMDIKDVALIVKGELSYEESIEEDLF